LALATDFVLFFATCSIFLFTRVTPEPINCTSFPSVATA
jgi:hypothetical protein